MYNYPGNPGFNRPPGAFGSFPGAPSGPPPGMGGAPGVGAPGVGPPPGTQQVDNSQSGPPGRFPSHFQPPANMPNINFNAPVIRLGTTGPAKPAGPGGPDQGRREGGGERSGRMGLGAQEGRRGGIGESAAAPLVPPTKDEVARTIFVGGITDGVGGDEGIERILRAAGSLRRWTRATDSDDKPCRFGFAEYDDPDSLATAVDVLKDVEVPAKPQPAANGNQKMDEDDESNQSSEGETSKLLVFIDDATMDYLQSYQDSRGDVDAAQTQARIQNAKQALETVLTDLANPSAPIPHNTTASAVDGEEASESQNGDGNNSAEVLNIPLPGDDELLDIPAEMRETVAKEIAAFRERSNRRDLERLKREEEIEAQDRMRRGNSPSIGGGANAIPVGPRDRSVANAPLGPKGAAGSQMPKDYQKNVAFVNGTASNGWIDREDEDTDADDEELERRKKSKKDEEEEKDFLNQERRWLNRERSRTAAIEREKTRTKEEDDRLGTIKEKEARRLREFNDDAEASRKGTEYYADRSQWLRNRAAARQREANLDDMDRAAEERERARDRAQQDKARGMADDFLSRQAIELDARTQAPQEPQRFKLSLGAAAQRAQTQAQSKRTVADVEGLLEDEEDEDSRSKRTLVPIKLDPAEMRTMTDEERQQAARSLAAEIPQDKDGLWNWPVKWDHVDDTVISEQLKPFVEKKILELLGVQEEMLVAVVETHVRKRSGPQELVEQLEVALDVDAELLVRKLWRMIIFYSESEKRGIAA